MYPSTPKKILFSNNKEGWKRLITKRFRYSVHKVYFDEITSKNSRGYDLVVPFTIQELNNKEIQRMLVNNPMKLPSIECILLCDDKYQFNNTLISKGLERFIPGFAKNQTYPYMLKKRIDEFGQNTHIIYSSKEEEQFSELLNSTEYFCQEIVTGKVEYATHIYIENRKIVRSLNVKYIFNNEINIKGKDKSIKVIGRCPYQKEFTTVLAAIGYEGLCCINYKVKDNLPLIIEINPRFGASLCSYFTLFV